MLLATLSAEQEAEAKILEAKIQKAIQTEIADLARLMVSKSDRELFGLTEFQVRDLVLRVGAKAYEEHLREKKTATRVPE
jgi:parvulin-like peptidyl-prolyl isomerase